VKIPTAAGRRNVDPNLGIVSRRFGH